MNVKDRIRQYVADAALARGQGSTPGDDDDLLQVLDSLQVLRMMLQMEREFSIRIENSDLTPENLGSVEKLAALVARKRHALECGDSSPLFAAGDANPCGPKRR